MGIQLNQYIKAAILVFSLFILGACSSTSEMDEASTADESSSPNAGSASSGAGSNAGQLTQDQIRAQNALRQTVFYFDFDVAEFKPSDRETLTYHARDLAANSSKRIRLEGHADERGTREYNLALGERRANGILNYFIVNGAARSQIEVVSYGEERLEQTGQTDQAHSRNRRVEVVAQ